MEQLKTRPHAEPLAQYANADLKVPDVENILPMSVNVMFDSGSSDGDDNFGGTHYADTSGNARV